MGIKGPDDVAKMGIDEYNKQCRGIVMRYAGEWEVSKPQEIVGRIVCPCETTLTMLVLPVLFHAV